MRLTSMAVVLMLLVAIGVSQTRGEWCESEIPNEDELEDSDETIEDDSRGDGGFFGGYQVYLRNEAYQPE